MKTKETKRRAGPAPEAVEAAPEAVEAAPAPEAVEAAPEAVEAAPEAVEAAPEAVEADLPTFAEILISRAEEPRKGKRSEVYAGTVLLRRRASRRTVGIGAEIEKLVRSGETFEELYARVLPLVLSDPARYPTKYLPKHLNFDRDRGTFEIVRYYDFDARSLTALTEKIREEIDATREASGLPSLFEKIAS